MGWSIPCWRSESASAAISAASKCRRGWNGFGSIWSTARYASSLWSNEPGSKPPSSRPSRASRPRPSRRLFTVDDLHNKFRVRPGPPRPGGIFQHAQPVARRLADVHVARDHGVEDGVVEVAAHLV